MSDNSSILTTNLRTTALAGAAQPQPGAPGIGDSLYPGFGNGGYDAQHYTLDLNVTDVDTSTPEAIRESGSPVTLVRGGKTTRHLKVPSF